MYFIVLLFLFFPYPNALAEKNVHLQQKNLYRLNQDIQAVQKLIANKDKEKKSLELIFKKNQKKLSLLYQQLERCQYSHQRLKNQQHQFKQQHQEHTILLKQKNKQLNFLFKTAYTLSYSTHQEVAAYCYYLYLSQQKTIDYLNQRIKVLSQQTQKLETKNQLLYQTMVQHNQDHLQLKSKQKNYQTKLSAIQQGLMRHRDKLKMLIKDKQALETLIQKLVQKSSSIQYAQFHMNSNINRETVLGAQYGLLQWPIQGKIIREYGESIEKSELRSTGVLLSTQRPQSVLAIHNGKVVFCDHLRGLGNLLILDHGQGDLSLYGNNQKLMKRVGDTVRKGEIIGKVNKTALNKNAPFYFEIRHVGKAVNPKTWCLKN